ncbi:Bud13p Ecym_8384 [Eremothecium cymbalariae DBVPG|uniref:Pre-mRNA-splicing factor CWC26 n=1 Tax=Eremothecium cymbalariae (strain CBS 270.75 / DBVPG 7215 / KCTC 17166 / NRRL Y-17582) TaxID=931890 RepID=G8JXT0_ERECY|nr:Hypothetical protein Ecym_8384 [Eremothecium cymbalariae DBVPG\
MSFNEYLNKAYGTQKKSKTTSESSPSSNTKFDIIDSSEHIAFANNKPLGISSSNKSKKKTGLWRNLDTNELIERQNIVAAASNQGVDNLKMSPGTRPGLQTVDGDSVKFEANSLKVNTEAEDVIKNQEPVFRDQKGLEIDNYQTYIQEEKRSEDLKEQARQKAINEINMGDIQLYQLKHPGWKPAQLRYNETKFEDPVLAFKEGDTSEHRQLSPLGRKLYNGIYPDNRFGICPGWRWDGVDRSTGFETKWFSKQNEINERRIQSFTRQQDF